MRLECLTHNVIFREQYVFKRARVTVHKCNPSDVNTSVIFGSLYYTNERTVHPKTQHTLVHQSGILAQLAYISGIQRCVL
jgi:hypothetical protein